MKTENVLLIANLPSLSGSVSSLHLTLFLMNDLFSFNLYFVNRFIHIKCYYGKFVLTLKYLKTQLKFHQDTPEGQDRERPHEDHLRLAAQRRP